MTQYLGEISWRFVRNVRTSGQREANRLAYEAARGGHCNNHDELIRLLENQARASKLMIKNLQQGLSGTNLTNEIAELMVEINNVLNMKLLKDYNASYHD